MSIIIKGMEMPKNCKSCPLRYSSIGYAWCDITGESLALEIDMRDYTCPLVEIPTPHGRLGDLDKLMTEFMDSDLDYLQRDDWKEIIQIVADADVVIEAEGREE